MATKSDLRTKPMLPPPLVGRPYSGDCGKLRGVNGSVLCAPDPSGPIAADLDPVSPAGLPNLPGQNRPGGGPTFGFGGDGGGEGEGNKWDADRRAADRRRRIRELRKAVAAERRRIRAELARGEDVPAWRLERVGLLPDGAVMPGWEPFDDNGGLAPVPVFPRNPVVNAAGGRGKCLPGPCYHPSGHDSMGRQCGKRSAIYRAGGCGG